MRSYEKSGMSSDPISKLATATGSSSQEERHGLLQEILRILKKILGYCLCAVTCGCVPRPNSGRVNGHDDDNLSALERQAVNSLISYLDSKESEVPTIDDERLRSLCILTYSDNFELQRSAALCFAEISTKMHQPLTEKIMDPLNVLLKCRDVEVLVAASLAICNFALDGPVDNKAIIVDSGSLGPLIQLLNSDNTQIQCNATGCLTTLASLSEVRETMPKMGALKPLLRLAKSKDSLVQRNAVGALLNLTHLASSHEDLVNEGAIPVLVEVQASKDPDVQFYTTAALGNLAINEKYRFQITAVGHYDVIRQLVVLVRSAVDRVRCQACLTLRNLACDPDHQVIVVRYDGLSALKKCMDNARGETLSAAMACVRNLSIHSSNEVPIICETFLSKIQQVLTESTNQEAQKNAIGIVRNLATGEHKKAILKTDLLGALCQVILRTPRQVAVSKVPMLTELTAALAILADSEEAKDRILQLQNGRVFTRLVEMVLVAPSSELRYNCSGTLAQLALAEIPAPLLASNTKSILTYSERYLKTAEASLVHVSLWTLLHLIEDHAFLNAYLRSSIPALVEDLTVPGNAPSDAIRELAENVKDKATAGPNGDHDLSQPQLV